MVLFPSLVPLAFHPKHNGKELTDRVSTNTKKVSDGYRIAGDSVDANPALICHHSYTRFTTFWPCCVANWLGFGGTVVGKAAGDAVGATITRGIGTGITVMSDGAIQIKIACVGVVSVINIVGVINVVGRNGRVVASNQHKKKQRKTKIVDDFHDVPPKLQKMSI